MKRTIVRLEQGREYVLKQHSNFESRFICLGYKDGAAVVMNVRSLWICTVHGVGMYEDGKIDWDYSTDGHFA